MIGRDLFGKFYWRYLLTLFFALAVVVFLNHLFQKNYLSRTLQDYLKREAMWTNHVLRLHRQPALTAKAWGAGHDDIRLLIYGPDGALVADSHPHWGTGQVAKAYRMDPLPGYFLADADLGDGGRAVLVQRRPPVFPDTQLFELLLAIVLILALVAAVLYPLTRSLSLAFGQLKALARKTADGQFGTRLELTRDDELGELVAAFNEMSEKLAEAERLNNRLLQDVSHELRSPLGRIAAFAETIEHRPKETAASLEGIQHEVALLDRLVGDLLMIAQFEGRTPPLELSRFSAEEWVTDLFSRLCRKAESAGIACFIEVKPGEAFLEADPQRLTQAVGNVFDNAVNAVWDSPQPVIRLKAQAANRVFTVEVVDFGPGIPESDLPHLFRRFYRSGDHRSRASGGMGLGLSISKAILSAHQGDIRVESREGEGTKVALFLPIP